MSKVNCEAVGKRRQASLRMARAELFRSPARIATIARELQPKAVVFPQSAFYNLIKDAT